MAGRVGELVRRLYTRRAAAETATPGDVELLRRVRWRLVAWSGAITLAILLVLGVALYVTTAQNLASTTEQALRTRAASVRDALQHAAFPGPGPDLYRSIGFAIGGPASGTVAVIVTPDDVAVVPRDAPTQSLPVTDEVVAARSSGKVESRVLELNGTSARMLTEPVDLPDGRYVVQVVAFRNAEEATLRTLVLILLLGGLGAVALALAGGWFYASRAMVPIRDSLRRQREFAADASHELRTPLTVLRASVEDLRRHPAEPVAKVGTALEDMTAEVDHMTELVDGLLLLARADSGVVELQRSPVDLADAVAAALGELTPIATDRGVSLELDAQPTTVQGDFSRLRQLAVILVDNAIRHAGGPVSVRVSVHREGSSALLRVEDTGRGIRPEDLPHVFERFWRASDAPSGGLGLGLAIASWIGERHGGSVTVGDRPGGGACFEARLPLSA
jgi:signal transduction histidine kinase